MISSFWYDVFWPYFQFAVFLVFLIYFARKPIRNLLQSKRDEFRTKLSEAHEALLLAERKIQKYESQIANLTQEIETIKNQHLGEAELEHEKILKEANRTAESILNDAKRIVHELISQTRHELKEEMFKLALTEFEKRLSTKHLAQIETKLQSEAFRSIPGALEVHTQRSSSRTSPSGTTEAI